MAAKVATICIVDAKNATIFNAFGLNVPSGSRVSSSVGVCGLLYKTADTKVYKCVIDWPINDKKIFQLNTELCGCCCDK